MMLPPNKLKNLFFTLRPTQWVKNAFLFLPALFGMVLFSPSVLLRLSVAFLIFCLASSFSYIVNDLIDSKRDKLHPSKRLRPICSGKVTKCEALILLLLLFILVGFTLPLLGAAFAVTVLLYILAVSIYSVFLKDIVIIDVFCIGLFFMLRIIGGAIAAEVHVSNWIVIMTVLLALFLGFNKRRQELKWLKSKAGAHRQSLKKYNAYFIDQMISVITASILVSYMLYTIDERTIQHFGSDCLIFTTAFVYYGIFRYLYLVHVRNIDGDPVRVIFSDGMKRLNLALWLCTNVIIIYFAGALR